jgi:uncharacterized protein (UPF0264 family)
MTRVLASVRSATEARIALDAGAGLIDLKDPAAGVLGALPAPAIRAAVARVAGRRCVSATAGDLPMEPLRLARAVAALDRLGVDFVKVGIFAGGDLPGCLAALGRAAGRGQRIVLVLFADRRPDFDLIARARDLGLAGVMLDTADKRAGGLRVHQDDLRLARFVRQARAGGLLCGLAGALRLADVPALAAHAPDYLGFRGALCRAGRASALDPARVHAVCAAVQSSAAASAATATAGAQRAARSRACGDPATSVAKST